MTVAALITKTDDVVAALREGYLLVVEKDQAFLADGQFAQGSNRPNVPVPVSLLADGAVVGSDFRNNLRLLTADEVKTGGCRPLHFHRKPKVYALKG